VVDLIVEMVIWIIGVATQIIYVSGKAFGSMDGIIEQARVQKGNLLMKRTVQDIPA
jgi:hypothetical protein